MKQTRTKGKKNSVNVCLSGLSISCFSFSLVFAPLSPPSSVPGWSLIQEIIIIIIIIIITTTATTTTIIIKIKIK